MGRPGLRDALSPEERVLLMSVREDSDSAVMAALLERCDLTRLLFLAVSEKATVVLWPRIAPLLAHRPPAELQALQRTARVSEFRLLLLEDRLRSTAAALAALPTPPVLLKGAALAVSTYRTFTDRPMGDLDILIAPADAAEAQRRLGPAGWKADETGDTERYAHHHHLPLISDAAGAKLSIELHTELFFEGNPFAFGAADVRADAVPATVGGRTVMVPSPLHRLLHCVLHFAWSHEMDEGAWRTFRDVHAIVRRDDVDWDAFVALARRVRGATAAYWTLRLARTLADVAAPVEVERALAPSGSAIVRDQLERHFALNVFPQTARSPSQWLSHRLWEAGVRPKASGHGASRPWMWDAAFGAVTASVLGGPGSSGSTSARARQLADRLGRWAVYGRRVLVGAASETS